MFTLLGINHGWLYLREIFTHTFLFLRNNLCLCLKGLLNLERSNFLSFRFLLVFDLTTRRATTQLDNYSAVKLFVEA
jgi:hypothetical protein